ncbi:MAG: UbiD family decarboxylase [Desulfuromonadales bacterium]|nr:UbiD family decarboxylase [Desulfuromonadales bacterium]
MGLRNLQQTVLELERARQLVRIDCEIDADQEAGIIQRRVYANGGPALLFTRVKGCAFPLLGNLFGTLERARFLFRDSLAAIDMVMRLKADPATALQRPLRSAALLPALWHALPKRVGRGPLLAGQTTLSRLPQLVSWPQDGGAFITLPQVYSEHPDTPGWRGSNLGMYRVQMSGGAYQTDREAGLHYQIHRGLGVHHAAALARGRALPVNVFVGGPPSLTVAAVMPLPEGVPELTFAGLLGGHRIPLVPTGNGLLAPAEADFCLCGEIVPGETRPEGPFGDHLGYYSLSHDFPVLRIDRIYHRHDAIWPFTTVGRPPQEDTTFGALIHEMTGPAIPSLVDGVRAVHAVDAAGVHPLLLAIGSERYTPYADQREPQELLTQANALLGQGQLSLAKYLLIVDDNCQPGLDLHDVAAFLEVILSRCDWRRDLHFQTRTTIDTLDYSGHGLNAGSKLVIAACGPARCTLLTELAADLTLPPGFARPRPALPGILVIEAPAWAGERGAPATDLGTFCRFFDRNHPVNAWPLLILVDDSEFASRNLANLLWAVFTRSDPASDIDGIGAFTQSKHWGCHGSLVIDARLKTHHPPPLEEDPAAVRRIEALATSGGPLLGLI